MRTSLIVSAALAATLPVAGLSAQSTRDTLPYLYQGDSYRGLFRGVEAPARKAWDSYRPGDVSRLVAQIDLLEREGRVVSGRLRDIRRGAVSLARIERSYLRDGISTGERSYLAQPYARLAYRLRTTLADA